MFFLQIHFQTNFIIIYYWKQPPSNVFPESLKSTYALKSNIIHQSEHVLTIFCVIVSSWYTPLSVIFWICPPLLLSLAFFQELFLGGWQNLLLCKFFSCFWTKFKRCPRLLQRCPPNLSRGWKPVEIWEIVIFLGCQYYHVLVHSLCFLNS